MILPYFRLILLDHITYVDSLFVGAVHSDTEKANINSKPRLLNIILLNLILVRWLTSAAIILKICGMRPSVFERLEL